MVKCPICGAKLQEKSLPNSSNKSLVCINNHVFDISKHGYVNLIPNYTKSGDNKLMIDNRKIVLDKGYFLPLIEEIRDIIKTLNINSILDIGCGEGYYDAQLVLDNYDIYGIDISSDAIISASKRCKKVKYYVASSNNIPFLDKSIDLSMSIFSPIYIDELLRVTKRYYLKIVPNDNHLLELKKQLYSDVYLNDVSETIDEHLKLINTKIIKYQKDVTDIDALFKMTPYYYTTHNNYDLKLEKGLITFSFVIRLYEII